MLGLWKVVLLAILPADGEALSNPLKVDWTVESPGGLLLPVHA